MQHRRLPDWLLSLMGLWTKTPRGMAERYAKSADLSLVLKPVFDEPLRSGLPALESQRPVPEDMPAPEAAADSNRLRAA